MNDRQRKLFVNVVDAGSFSKAAAEGFVTPQSVSQQIRKLEAEVGVDLLERKPQGVVPTEAGQAFYQGCLDIERSIEALVETCRILGGDMRLTIRLGVGRDYSMGLFNLFLPDFLRTHPNVDLEYVDVDRDSVFEGLLDGSFDVAESIRPKEDHPDIGFQKLRSIRRCCLVSARNPLARKPAIVPQDLRGQQVYVFSLAWATDLQAYLQRVCPDIQLLEAPPNSKMTPQRFCESGEAVYLVPTNLQEHFMPLIPVPLDVDLANDYGLVFPAADEERLADFLECARQTFAHADPERNGPPPASA